MADVRPFRGIRYNPERIDDLSLVICPPYDVISPSDQEALYKRHPHNVVRLELGQTSPNDSDDDNQYTRAGALFRQWRRDGDLVCQERPAYYLVEETFSWQGEDAARYSLWAAVRLEPFDREVVLPHEHTRPGPKEDRLRLMQAAEANLSPVMALYRDNEGSLSSLLAQAVEGAPSAVASPVDGQSFRLWVLDDPQATAAIQAFFSDRPLYLADGHHRYETALHFRDLAGPQDPEAARSFAMLALISMDDPGLKLEPYHRVLAGLDLQDQAAVDEALARLTPQGEIDIAGLSPEEAAARIMEPIRTSSGMTIAVLRAGDGLARLMSLEDTPSDAAFDALGHCDPWVLQQTVLTPALGEQLSRHADYTHDPAEAVGRVQRAEIQVAVLLRPMPLDVFEEVVRRGRRLPTKSTFFIPKLPTGLVINDLA